MTQNLLPIRILFHSAFALVYLPTIVLSFVLDDLYGGPISLSSLGGLGIFAALDIFNICRKVNQKAFLCIDIFVAVCLPGCIWPLLYESIAGIVSMRNGEYDSYLAVLDIPLEVTSTFIIIGLSTSYVLYIIVAAVIDKIGGNTFLPSYPDESLLSSSGTRGIVFIGHRRTPTERAVVIDNCASFIFRRSIFRKHAFEPTGWAIFRGTIALYCFAGLLVFAAYIGYSEGETYSNVNGTPIQETALSSVDVRNGYIAWLSVAMLNPTSQPIPSDLVVSRWSGYSSLTQNVTASDSQFWTDNAPYEHWAPNDPLPEYPFIPHNHFNVSWSGDVTLDIWITASDALNGSTDSIQAHYSPGFPLVPFKEYDITLTIISYKVNGLSWLFFEPQVRNAVSSGSNTTIASFSCSWQSQRQITHRDLSAPSALAVLAGAISSIGGVYAFIDGVFALIFGRTMLAILFGTRAISPFGMLGMITRNRFRRLIHEQYPYLQEDIERGGMAAYVSEVAIDPGLVRSDSAHRRSRVATSSPGPRTDGYTDPGVIHLRSMESSKTRDSTGRSLPYVVEAYEPSKKYDYE